MKEYQLLNMLRLLIQRTYSKTTIPQISRSCVSFSSIRHNTTTSSTNTSSTTTPITIKTNSSESKTNGTLVDSNKFLRTTYESIDDYGSYKHNIFTHRLPESSAKQSPPLVALHNRLQLPKSFKLATLSQCLNLITKPEESDGLANNFGLNTLGKSLLSYYVTEHLLIHYPRLPMKIHQAAVDSLMGNLALLEIGKTWGIEIDEVSKLDRFLGQESEFMKFGRLRYLYDQDKSDKFYNNNGNYKNVSGIEEVIDEQGKLSQQDLAYASAVKAIIGGLYTHCGESAAKDFINDHILSRKIPLDQMFEFKRPISELIRLCDKLEFKQPVSIRLIAETGRLSAHPQFLAGVFVGNDKIGEGIGSSLKEAQIRASINSLLGYYLYSPISANGEPIKEPSDSVDYKFEGMIGLGDVAV